MYRLVIVLNSKTVRALSKVLLVTVVLLLFAAPISSSEWKMSQKEFDWTFPVCSDWNAPVREVISVQSQAPPEIPYGVEMVGAPLQWGETTGEGIKVAVLDTGKPNHPDIKVAGAVSFVDAPVDDVSGHATHVAGIIAANGKIKGVAPGVELYCLKVATSGGSISKEAIVRALRWCRENRIDVVNMSFGGPSPDAAVEAELKACYEAGIVLVASAGNFGVEYGVIYPARYGTVIAVAAVDSEKQHTGWSSIGKEVEVAAAGAQVWSTWLNGQYALLEGTSMAAPHITGAVALIQAKAKLRFGRKLSPDQVRLLLQAYAEDVGAKGPDEKCGFGVFSFGPSYRPARVSKVVEMWVGKKQYMVNGQLRQMDVAPFLQSGRTFVPVRFAAEGLGASVEWFAGEGKVRITGDD